MNSDLGYLKGAIYNTGTIAILAASATLEEQGIEHSLIGIWKQGNWVKNWREEIAFTSIAQGSGRYSKSVVFMGMCGDVLIGTPQEFRAEQLAKGPDAPNRLRTIHEVRAIGEYFFAVGMRRQVFRKHMGSTSWERVDEGVFITNKSKTIAGFLSIDGFSEKEVYAVGHRGEIWIFDGSQWRQIESPTNLILNCVRCTPQGQVFACGQSGVILSGRGSTWTELKQDITDEMIVSLAALGDRVYFATGDAVLFSLEDGKFHETRIKRNQDATTGFLDSNGQELLSVGEKDIYRYNGAEWSRISDPEFNIKE